MSDTFDLPAPDYNEDEGFWLCMVGGLEVSFRGDPGSVDLTSVELARQVLPGLPTVEAEGRAFLHEFVDPGRFQDLRDYYNIAEVGDWKLLVADFGRRADLRPREFELLYTLREDVYGLWGVRFDHDHGNGASFPVEFRRRQW